MHWSSSYVGLPWQVRGLTRDGIACWGLAKLAYAEVLGLDVPDYAAAVSSLQMREEVAAVFSDGIAAGPWIKVELADAREFDVLVFRIGGREAHVGLVSGPGRMLHIGTEENSEVTSYVSGRWAPRLAGVYRHRAMAEAGTVRIENHTPARVDVRQVPDGRGGRRTDVVVREA